MNYAEAANAGQEAANRGDHAAAAKHFAAALEMRPNFAPLLGAYVQSCIRNGDKREAVEKLERYLALDRSNPKLGLLYTTLAAEIGAEVKPELVRKPSRASLSDRLQKSLGRFGRKREDALVAEADRGSSLAGLSADEAALVRRARDLAVRGRLAEAQEAIGGVPEVSARRPAVLEMQGLLQMRYGRLDEAIALFEEALQASPDDPALHADILTALIAGGRLGAAAETLAAMTQEIRGSADVAVAEAALLNQSGRADDALAALDRAEGRPDLAGPASDLRARVLSGLGRFDEAQAAIERLSDARPGVAGPFMLAALNRRLEPGSPLHERAEALLDDANATQEQRAGAAFALGAALRAAGEHEASFDRIEQANGLIDRIYDFEAEEANVALLKRMFPPGPPTDPAAADRGRGLVFVVGLPRSGSTLVSLILGRHPEAVSVGEFQAFHRCLSLAQEAGYPERTHELQPEFLASLADAYLRELPPAARDAAFVIDKELTKSMHLGLMRLIFPGARFVHSKRDAMDVCFSIYSQWFAGAFPYAYRQSTLAHFHALHEQLMEHWRQVLDDALYDCSYEGLVAEPQAEIPLLLEAAGMDFDERCLHPEGGGYVLHTASVHQVRQGIYGSSVGTWRRHADRLATLSQAFRRDASP